MEPQVLPGSIKMGEDSKHMHPSTQDPPDICCPHLCHPGTCPHHSRSPASALGKEEEPFREVTRRSLSLAQKGLGRGSWAACQPLRSAFPIATRDSCSPSAKWNRKQARGSEGSNTQASCTSHMEVAESTDPGGLSQLCGLSALANYFP